MQGFPFSAKARAARPQPIGELMARGNAADAISLAAGLVDSETLPVEEIAAAFQEFARERGRLALQYGTTEGLMSLRTKILARLERTDGPAARAVGVDRVILSTGSQQLLYMLTEIMVDPGDIVITAAPSYFVYLGTLENAGAEVVGVPIDGDGMRIDLLEEAIRGIVKSGRGHRLKIIYVTSYFQNPSGVSLSHGRRGQLLCVVKNCDAVRPLIIEDAAYRELAFDGTDTPSLWSCDEGGGRVAYLGTFSKPFSPGLRTGFGVLPAELMEKVRIIKCGHDFGSANFTQHLVDFAIERGIYDRNLRVLRKNYAAKCRAMCQSLRREMGGIAQWQEPLGGLYVWVDLPGIDTGPESEFFARCAREGVLYVPGEFCYSVKKSAPTSRIRLSFAPTPVRDIEEGVARLGRAARGV